jgi:hypothetical protein
VIAISNVNIKIMH